MIEEVNQVAGAADVPAECPDGSSTSIDQLRGDVDPTFLTSLVDRDGALRVQYMGVRFDPDEMLRDLRSLLREGGR